MKKPRSLAVIAAVLACVIGPAATAQASSVTTTVVDVYSGQCLDNHTNGAVFTDACDGYEQQRWILTAVGSGLWTIKDAYSGQCLDNHIDGAVFTDTCDGYQQQEWNLYQENGADVIQDAYSAECLDNHTNGAVFTDTCDGYRQQSWYA